MKKKKLFLISDLVYEEMLLYHYPDFKKTYLEKISKGESVTKHIVENDNKNIVRKHFYI